MMNLHPSGLSTPGGGSERGGGTGGIIEYLRENRLLDLGTPGGVGKEREL
jgi:hypothetical protein